MYTSPWVVFKCRRLPRIKGWCLLCKHPAGDRSLRHPKEAQSGRIHVSALIQWLPGMVEKMAEMSRILDKLYYTQRKTIVLSKADNECEPRFVKRTNIMP